jgi:hypothetical protein
MKFVVGTILLVVLLVLFAKHIEELVMPLLRRQRRHHERISALEVHEVTQDIKLHDQSTAIHDQGVVLHEIRGEVRTLGNDIGWDDDKRNTEVIDIHERETPVECPPLPDDEPPPEAA